MSVFDAIVDMTAKAKLAGIKEPFSIQLGSLDDGRALEAEMSALGFTRDLRYIRGEDSINGMMVCGVRVTWPERAAR